jgi:hypothetical protein
MASLTVDKVIHNAIKKGHSERGLLDPNVNSYFFFKQELGGGKKPQHAIPNKKKIFDYIQHQYYDTVLDWAVANGLSLDDIMYGNVNSCYNLNELLTALDPKWRNNTNVSKSDRDELLAHIKLIVNDIKTTMDYVNELIQNLD